MKNGFLKKNSYKNKAFTLACDSEHPPCHPERGSRCECDGADEALIRSTMTLVSGSNKQKTPVSVETLSTHFFLFGSNLAVQKEETGGAQRKKNVGFLPPGKSKICPLASLCSRSQRRLSAFTLAEVLITLAIIGVVAALTIPTVVRNYQELQYKTAYKKAYSDLSRAFASTVAFGELQSRANQYDAVATQSEWNIMKTNFKAIKECSSNNTFSCWVDADRVCTGCGSETSPGAPSGANGAFIDASGRAWAQYNTAENIYLVDVNGDKKPNQFGKDRWMFTLRDAQNNRTTEGLPMKVSPFILSDYLTKNTWCQHPPCYYKSWLVK